MIPSLFPYFGGKSTIAQDVWERFGSVKNMVEPFCGSAAVTFARPGWEDNAIIETINDANGFVANAWRAIQHDPDQVAHYADEPVIECNLHAIHRWLKAQKERVDQLEHDVEFYDAKVAGWWIWGMCCWIGSGFCSSDCRQIPHVGNTGMGINRTIKDVPRQIPHLGGPKSNGVGINRSAGKQNRTEYISELISLYSRRLRDVRVCSGDWSRVCGDSVTFKHGLTAVFLDPPYSDKANRDANIYSVDSLDVAHDVRKWAIENGDNPLMRIALCGYHDEHEMPDNWTVWRWKAGGGYMGKGAGQQAINRHKEAIFFSPHCLSGSEQQQQVLEI